MVPLPVIVGFGGVSPAGRSSFHHAYRRIVAPELPANQIQDTYLGLATLMNLLQFKERKYRDANGKPVNISTWLRENQAYIDNHTLVRRLEDNLFDPQALPRQIASVAKLCDGEQLTFKLRKRHLPQSVPENWQVTSISESEVSVVVTGSLRFLYSDPSQSPVNAAGQLPSGFDPAHLYPSRNHPRGLQLTVYGASDAINSMGIPWEEITQRVAPDEIGVYATSGMGQLDQNANGGLLQARLKGKRVTSKQLPLGFPEMPADFVNAYIIGSVGSTGGQVGACATFLYNLRQGIDDIRSGRKRVVIVGNSEAPITPEVIDGYCTMGALADDLRLRALDGVEEVDYRRACRPFSDNCGFTLSESSQFFVLFDDALAVEMGATIYGGVGDVFVNADGFKKSISSPGIGNYVTMAKATAAAKAIVGQAGLNRSFVQAHGTGTPKNRVTESHILSETAKAFGIQNWPIVAIKSYLGHSIASAAADQLTTTLGVWEYGILPAINTIDHLADDVHTDRLEFLLTHSKVAPESIDVALLNSKGFGGNNASACILAPHEVNKLIRQKHGKAKLAAHARANEGVREQAQAYDAQSVKGLADPIYRFGEDVKGGADISLNDTELNISGYNSISLAMENPYL